MKNSKVVIVDDEPRAIGLLKHYVSKVDELEIKQTFHNSVQALKYLNSEDIDILFLDINMPHINGLDLLKSLKSVPKVIFTTAHSEYAIDGFDLNAVDYLLKPISFPRFMRAIHKAQLMHTGQNRTQSIPKDAIYIKNGSSTNKFYWTDINFLEKSENYVIFHLKDGKRILSRQTLSNLEKGFPNYLVRIHRSYAICMYNLNSVRSNTVHFGDRHIPIGRIYKNLFIEKFQAFSSLV